jgi:hypothetical protein
MFTRRVERLYVFAQSPKNAICVRSASQSCIKPEVVWASGSLLPLEYKTKLTTDEWRFQRRSNVFTINDNEITEGSHGAMANGVHNWSAAQCTVTHASHGNHISRALNGCCCCCCTDTSHFAGRPSVRSDLVRPLAVPWVLGDEGRATSNAAEILLTLSRISRSGFAICINL